MHSAAVSQRLPMLCDVSAVGPALCYKYAVPKHALYHKPYSVFRVKPVHFALKDPFLAGISETLSFTRKLEIQE